MPRPDANLPEHGSPADDVLGDLDARLAGDRTYDDGRILGTMICRPHPLAVEVFGRTLTKNIADAGLYPALVELEHEAVAMMGGLLSNTGARGHIVTGGSEANVIALWAALRRRGRPGRVLLPETAHFSFDKAADLTGHELVRVAVDDGGRLELADLDRRLAEPGDVAAVVAVAGTTDLGAVDPVAEIGERCAARDAYFHVDAAFGGFVLPFIDGPAFDFAVPAVDSMTIDPHKMGWSVTPAGGILFRDEATADLVATPVSYLSGGRTSQRTLVGTRSGAAVAATWAMLRHLGRAGYAELVSRCLTLARDFAARVEVLEHAGLACPPALNVVGIRSRRIDAETLATRLRERGWSVSLFPRHVRVVVMPHVEPRHLDAFLDDLEDVV